jgi:hypothetical protein
MVSSYKLRIGHVCQILSLNIDLDVKFQFFIITVRLKLLKNGSSYWEIDLKMATADLG